MPARPRPPLRIAAAILTAALAALGAWAWVSGNTSPRVLWLIGLGVVLGAVYSAVGRVPPTLRRWSGANLTDDDDPRNLSPKIYLPVLLLALTAAALAYYLLGPRR